MSSAFKLYPTTTGIVVESEGKFIATPADFTLDGLFSSADPAAAVQTAVAGGAEIPSLGESASLVQNQEVWAAGVTYLRSRTARMDESKDAGGGDFYDRVYEAQRPELFLKATPHRVAPPGGEVRIRRDSNWNVPEPELTLAINAQGTVFGYTMGNDMSSRDIEGENPLYLPQAKCYHLAAALGPCLVVMDTPPDPTSEISLRITREGAEVFGGSVSLNQIKRPLESLADWLYRDNVFPVGAYLMTGTGIVPPDEFTLQPGDEVHISHPDIGTLTNVVAS